MGNNLDGVLVSYVLTGEELLELIQPALCRQVSWRTSSHEACGADDQIHVCGGEVETGHKRTEGVDRGARKVPSVASHRLSKVLDEVVADSLFEIAGSDVFVEVDDLFV